MQIVRATFSRLFLVSPFSSEKLQSGSRKARNKFPTVIERRTQEQQQPTLWTLRNRTAQLSAIQLKADSQRRTGKEGKIEREERRRERQKDWGSEAKARRLSFLRLPKAKDFEELSPTTLFLLLSLRPHNRILLWRTRTGTEVEARDEDTTPHNESETQTCTVVISVASDRQRIPGPSWRPIRIVK